MSLKRLARTLGCFKPLGAEVEGHNESSQHAGRQSALPAAPSELTPRRAVELALCAPGQTVEISLRHPQPVGKMNLLGVDPIKNPGLEPRATPDVRLAVTYQRESRHGGRLELESSRYDMPAKLEIGPRKDRGALAREFEALLPELRCAPQFGLTAHDVRREGKLEVSQIQVLPADRTAPSRLPGPPVSTLTDKQLGLVGVARWPDPQYNKEDHPDNRAYGLRFYATAQEAACRIADGQITNFRQLWDFAGAARQQWQETNTATFQNLNSDPPALFGTGYPRQNQASAHPLTALNGMYQYVADRMLSKIHAGQVPEKWVEHDPESGSFTYTAHVELNGRSVGLTQLVLNTLPQDGEQEAVSYALHTLAGRVPKAINHVEQIVGELLRNPPQDRAELMHTLGDIHWWMAHAMPDPRGSAAKTEISVRALAGALGVELPPFRHGVVADLEAFMSSQEEFSKGYAQMFEDPSRVSAPPSR